MLQVPLQPPTPQLLIPNPMIKKNARRTLGHFPARETDSTQAPLPA